MLRKFLILLCYSAAGALATKGVFNPPKGTSFLTIDYRVGFPMNVTTLDGEVAAVPIVSGTIKGRFNGHIVQNVSSSLEGELESDRGVFTSFDARYLFENDDGERILATVLGATSYSSKDLHGLGYATLRTTIKGLEWVNTAMFVAEWMGRYGGRGAEIEIFELTTGGRIDCDPIHAAFPPS
ncbi:hypothetical protein ACJ73_09323 [Blastomyces percursus]|uniref:Lipid/polyisoprenoid-binding YceI-like domain-containing protein n=1 Tax=Blastomyces percursus TaxID=1658174 RepID=A0A1J9P824_9EURO|nr:hypothetical protein ACJ73_09323 [Blastomyces percursus]